MKKLSSLFLSVLLIGLFGLNAFNADAEIVISSVTFNPLTSNPGTVAIGTFTVTNTDNVSLNVLLSSLILTRTGGTETITAPSMSPSQINVGDTPVPVSFIVNVPATRAAGSYTSTIEAKDALNNLLLDTQAYTLTVNALPALEVTGDALSDNLLTIATPKDYNDDMELVLKNTGNTVLTFPNQVISPITFEDADGDKITIKFTNLPSTLAPNDLPVTVTLTFDVDQDVDADVYPTSNDGKIVITAQGFTKEINLKVDVTAESVCEDGRRSDGNHIGSNSNGNLRVTDFDVDPNNDFGPGEIIEIRNVDVSNEGDDNIDDVIVEAVLYNVDQDEVIARAESNSEDIDDNDKVQFDDFELEVPSDSSDLDEDDKYILYIQAFEDGKEDENCNYDSIDDIEFQRKSDDVAILSASATPSPAMCNANVNFVVEVQNVGEDDQDTVTIKLMDSTLNLDFESDPFSLDQFDDRDDTYTLTQSYKIPATAEEGTHNVEVMVVFDRGKKTESEFLTFNVNCGGVSGTDGGNIQISLVQDSITASQGKLFGLPFKLMNNADEVQTYVVDVSPSGNWADKPQSQTVSLQP